MKFYSVLEVTPTTDAWIPEYLGSVNVLVAKHGGKYLARTSSHERLEGVGEEVGLRVLIEWPTKEAGNNFMNDPEYKPLLEARTAGSNSHHALIEGKDDFA